jgi:photosystem II stability/assembly factor-like uncharacterized protein
LSERFTSDAALALEQTTDGGTSWHTVIPAGQQNASFSSPDFLNADDGIVGAELTGHTPGSLAFDVDSTTDGGATWTAHHVPVLPTGTARSLFPLTPTSWVVASTLGVAFTSDAGAHWSTVVPKNEKFSGAEEVAFSSRRDGLAAFAGTSTNTFDNPEWLYRTTDSGRTWQVVPTSTVKTSVATKR